MNRKYDVFERFSDGSSLWRACVVGLEGTRLHLGELGRKSNNRFYAIAHANGKTIYPASTKVGPVGYGVTKRSNAGWRLELIER